MKHVIVAMALAVAMLFTPAVGVSVSYADNCAQKQVVCPTPPTIDYEGMDVGNPNLLPRVCLSVEALAVLKKDQTEFWFTYYQRYSAVGAEDDMEPVMRVECITEQWVFSGTRIGFWVDCPDEGYTYWFETKPITDNGTYTMEFLRKVEL